VKAIPTMYLVGALSLMSACGGSPGTPSANNNSIPTALRVAGELHSANSLYYGPPSVSEIWKYTISYMAADGSEVKRGQRILGFDTQELTARLREKSGELNTKQKELQKQQVLASDLITDLRLAVEEARAERDKAALKADIPENLLAKREYREHQLTLRQAELTLALKQAEVKAEERTQATEAGILESEISVLGAEVAMLQKSIESMTILAPDDGVVIHTTDQRGNKLEVGDNVWGGRRVIEFPDLSRLELRLEIPERKSASMKMGLPVSFVLDAAPEKRFRGEIVSLASVIRTRGIEQPAKVFDITVGLSNPDPEIMRPGMSVNAEIESATEQSMQK